MAKKKTTKKPAKKCPPKKKGPGRPKKREVDDELIRQFEVLAGLGMSINEIALVLDLSHMTVKRYKESEPRLQEAWQRGIAKSLSRVAKRLIDDALDGNTTAQIYFLKAKGGAAWTDRPNLIKGGELQQEGSKHEVTINVRAMDSEQRDNKHDRADAPSEAS